MVRYSKKIQPITITLVGCVMSDKLVAPMFVGSF